MPINPATAARILDATYLQPQPTCPDCGHVFTEATLREIEAHILAAHQEPTPAPAAIIHLTFTGYAAGTPFCGCDKAYEAARGARFAHVPYTHADVFLARLDICPACRAEWNAAGTDDE